MVTIINEKVSDDPFCQKWMAGGHIGDSTLHSYRYGLNEYCAFTGMTPAQLIEEAREDYEARVPPWKLRHANRFMEFIAYLKKLDESRYGNNTKLNYAKGVRNFYVFNRITFPDDVKISIVPKVKDDYRQLPVWKIEDIRKMVLECGTDKFLKALILTIFSSGQGQAEIRSLKGYHLKNIKRGVAVVKMQRNKTGKEYFFFISHEALDAIHEYKPNLKDDEFVFTRKRECNKEKSLMAQEVDKYIANHAEKCGFDKSYLAPHRGRRYWTTNLTGKMTERYIEYLLAHAIKGVAENYFDSKEIQDKMLEEYLQCQHILTVFTDKEVLQQQYDELKKEYDDAQAAEINDLAEIAHSQDQEISMLKQQMASQQKWMQKLISQLPPEVIKNLKVEE